MIVCTPAWAGAPMFDVPHAGRSIGAGLQQNWRTEVLAAGLL